MSDKVSEERLKEIIEVGAKVAERDLPFPYSTASQMVAISRELLQLRSQRDALLEAAKEMLRCFDDAAETHSDDMAITALRSAIQLCKPEKK